MFLHLSVNHSVYREGGSAAGGSASRERCLQPGGSASRGSASGGSASSHARPGPPPSDTKGYGQQAGSAYPTGMQSCFTMVLKV